MQTCAETDPTLLITKRKEMSMLLGKYINRYYVKYWYYFLLGVAALVAVDYAQLFIPEFLGVMVENLRTGNTDSAVIGKLCTKILGVAAVMFIGRMAWRYTLFNASQRIEAGLRRDMFQKSERLSRKYYHENKTGSIMSWFTTDLETIEEYCGFGTVQLVDAFFLGLLDIVRMIMLDWVLTLFALIPMILIIVWGALVEKFMAMKWETRQKEYDRLYDFTQENFTGIRVIKAFVKETKEIHAFAKVAKKNKDANVSFVRVSVFFDAVIELIIAAIMALIMGFGGWLVFRAVNGDPVVFFSHNVIITPGNLVTFIGYFDFLVWPLMALGLMITSLSRSKTSLKRISTFLDSEEDVRSPEGAQKLENVRGDIEFRNCSFSYPGKKNAVILDGINLKINAGETVGIIGRVGSGKSTLTSVLSRMYNFEPGTVFIDGHDLMDCDIDSVRAAVAYVPQENFLFSDTVSGNIAFSKASASEDEIKAAAEFADVASNIENFPDRYDTVTGERGVTLSGGQKQRISIARAYLKNAPIMVLDDSVSAVDVGTEEKILANIKEKRAGKTTLIVASRISTVSHLDRVIVLNEGRLEAFDSPENLLKNSPTYAKMAFLQELELEVERGKN